MSHSQPSLLVRGLVVLVAGVLLTVAPGVAPAQAAPVAVDVFDVDTSVPGRVSATVSTDADTVRVALRRSSGSTLDADAGTFPVTDGEALVDVATWGMRTTQTYVLVLTGCPTGSTQTGCATVSAPFTPTDVTPEVAFSQDDTLTGTEQATMTLADDGGGELHAFYRGPFTGQPLHDGSQVLRLANGVNQVVVARCNGRLGCNYFGISKDYTVDKGEAVGSETYASVLPDGGPAPDTEVEFRVTDTVPYTFRGHLLPSAHATTEGWPEIVAEDLRPVDGAVTIPLDLTAMSHGGYVLVGELTRTTSAGPVTQWAHARPEQVDREGPRFQFGSVNAEVLHPVRDGHADQVSISANYFGTDTAQAALTVVHGETGTEVEVGTVSGDAGVVSAVWDGRTPDGGLAPVGTWEVRFTGVDLLGNRTEAVAGRLRLTHKRVVEVRTVFTVSAQQSRTDTGALRCGRVVRDPGGWQGGLGYRTRPCSNRASASTAHELDEVPRGWLGGKVAVAGRGRSAEHRSNMVPREARLILLSDPRRPSRRMLAPDGWYSTRLVRHGASEAAPVEWAVRVDGGAQRYDVHTFRVVFEGRALR